MRRIIVLPAFFPVGLFQRLDSHGKLLLFQQFFQPGHAGIVEEYQADTVIMYDQISCKGMDGLAGIFDDQARARNINFIWVKQDLMDPRTISRREMREQVNRYMRTVLQEEPVDPSLVDFEDDLAW